MKMREDMNKANKNGENPLIISKTKVEPCEKPYFNQGVDDIEERLSSHWPRCRAVSSLLVMGI